MLETRNDDTWPRLGLIRCGPRALHLHEALELIEVMIDEGLTVVVERQQRQRSA